MKNGKQTKSGKEKEKNMTNYLLSNEIISIKSIFF